MQHKTALSKTVRILAALMVALATVLPTVVTAAPATAPSTSPLAQPEAGTISGTVFRDYNANGTQQTWANSGNTFNEPGIAGVVITAYDVSNTVRGTATSGATGTYSLSATGTGPYRIEFTLPTDGSLDFLSPGAAGATTVQFVPDGISSNVNAGFNNPIDYSQDAPMLVTPITFVGSRSSYPTGRNESIVGIGYNASGDLSGTGSHTTYARISATGTLYGMIYQRQSKLILAGAYMKSYADLGPTQSSGWLQNVDPAGAIYASRTNVTLPNEAVYANLNKIIDPSTGLIVPGNPAGVNPRQTSNYNYTSGVCPSPGTTTPTTPTTGDCWNHDPAAWDKVGSVGLGDLDEDDQERFVFVVNMADKRLYQLPIDPNPANWPITTLAAPPVTIPNSCAVSSDAVPGGLGFKDGKLYVGVTCTAESTQNLAQLKAEVWEFNPTTQTFAATPAFSMPLNYTRGCIWTGVNTSTPASGWFGTNDPKSTANNPNTNCQTYLDNSDNDFHNVKWNPWPQTWQAHYTGNKGVNAPGKPGWTNENPQELVQIEYPHPWLSDIVFDGDDILLGFRDINGDRTGNQVRSPNITATAPPTNGSAGVLNDITTRAYVMNGAGFGDLMRACGTPGAWTLENNGVCGSLTAINGQNRGQGPGTLTGMPSNGSTGAGEFYWDDSGPGSRNPDAAMSATWAFQDWADRNNAANNDGYSGHEETLKGGLFQRSGAPDLAITQADQLDSGDGGIARFSSVVDHPLVSDPYPGLRNPDRVGTAFGNNEVGIALRHTALYGTGAGFFAKANGLGDVEALVDSAPLELGNRLWCDTGVSGVGAYNGIQDPGETAAPNDITVRLTCGAQYAEVNTSGGTGSYLFTDAIWDASANAAGIIPRNATCTISVATTGANGTALTNACGGIAATVPNAQGDISNSPVADIRDSDATVVFTGGAITSAQIQVLTGGPGVNNHGLDFGFAAPQDYGDAPDPTYPTLASSNGARHTIVTGVRMGPAVDSEQNGQPNAAATGDDTANVDDEDAVTFSALAAGQPAVASINMAGLSGTPVCYLNAWIDFNGNGSWESPAEQIATNVALNGGGIVPVNFTVPGAVTTSPTYARFRCSTTQSLTPTGPAPNGEVEDYRVTIEQTASLDYGDAPDPTYPTLSGNGGASHVLGQNGPRLGACVDAESNGQPNAGATGDDTALGSPVFGTCSNNDDEDGVTIPALTEGSASNLTINVSNAACVLNAWIDFNGDGDWNDAGEQVATNAAMAIGANTLAVTPPAASTQATTFARFRCSTQSGLGTTGAAADGEVEDYTLTIAAGPAPNDWGDAPDTGAGTGAGNYQTQGSDNGAHHVMNANVYLGACVDAEANGQQSVGATGDDTNATTPRHGTCASGNDDEDGVTIPTLLAGQTAQVAVSRTAATACYLNGWIDFNGNGSWLDAGEQVATNVLLPSGITNLAVAVPGSAVNGQTYARFRCGTQQNLAPTGVATDGEVEDYAVQITGVAVDWGDLPDGPYATLSANSGPSHILSGVAYMGLCVDSESNGQPNGTATGDDANATTPRLGACATGNDDEDGVTFGTLTAGTNGSANVSMAAFSTGAQVCFLNAWIDFNGNGSFADAGEQIATNVQMVGGSLNAGSFPIPSVVTSSPTGARFRCSTQPGLTPTGPAPNGEVEDYMVTITPQSRDFGDAPDTAAGTGVGNYNTTVADNGPSHLIVANLRLGGVNPDADSGTLQNAAADADDTTNTDDEEGVGSIPPISTATTSVQLPVTVFNNIANPATVACWIDFNRDGVFSNAERASATVGASSGTTTPTLTFSGFSAPVPGLSYLRCRIATAAGEVANATGPAATGEVEDYPLNISGVDYGDAPDTAPSTAQGNYNTLGTDSGPYHVLSTGLHLGNVAPDADPATLQDNAAAADNATNVNDEDGISILPQILHNTTTVNMTVRATNSTATAAVMACWIDFNRDGDFLDAGERSANVAVPASSGSANYSVSLTGFAAPTLGTTYIRCRIAYVAGEIANPTGGAATGEVEDYRTEAMLAVLLANFDATSQADHVLVAWETVSEANNAGFNLYRSLSADGPYALLGFTPSAAPGSTAGAAYSYQDFDVVAGQAYWYQMEDIDLSGAATMHGPVSVVYQAPTAVTLNSVQADGGQTGSASLALLAGLLAAAGAAVVYRRRSAAA
jgi:hypothetical protein